MIAMMSAVTPKVIQKANREPVRNSTLFWRSSEKIAATKTPILIYPNLGNVSKKIPNKIPITTDKQTVKIKIPLDYRQKSV